MSLPWLDTLHIGLAPTQVAHARHSFGSRGARLVRGAIRVEPCHGAPAWRAALDTLGAALPALRVHGARARVVLSNHFVRYAVVRWRGDLRSPAEREAFVRHRFREIYGDAADGWEVRESLEPFGRASLACAVDMGLAAGVRELLRGARLRLAVLEPLLMAAFNAHRGAFGPSGCFLVHERGRLCGASFSGGEWREAIAVRTEAPHLTAAAIERELLVQGLPDDAPVFVRIVDGSPPPAALTRPVRLLEPPKRGAAVPDAQLFAPSP